jgi:hypothetical protein
VVSSVRLNYMVPLLPLLRSEPVAPMKSPVPAMTCVSLRAPSPTVRKAAAFLMASVPRLPPSRASWRVVSPATVHRPNRRGECRSRHLRFLEIAPHRLAVGRLGHRQDSTCPRRARIVSFVGGRIENRSTVGLLSCVMGHSVIIG